jgi:hypothetical protein
MRDFHDRLIDAAERAHARKPRRKSTQYTFWTEVVRMLCCRHAARGGFQS